MTTSAKNSLDIEAALQEYLQLPYRVSRFLRFQESEANVFEQYFKEASGELLLKFTPPATAEGPPNHCHGGFIATFLDECMGGCAWWNTYVVLAGNLNIKYRKPAPLHEPCYAIARIERAERRRVYCSAKLYNRAGTVLAEGEGVFVRLSWEKFPADTAGHFTIIRDFLEMRAQGIPFRDCIEKLSREKNRLTPPA